MKRYLMILAIAAAICAALPAQAQAMTGAEFMAADFSAQLAALKPFVLDWVAKGYKQVPDTGSLSYHVDALIREKGYGPKNLEEFVEEAAQKAGMQP